MVKDDVIKDTLQLIKGKKSINPAAENNDLDLAQQIVADQINEERERKGIIPSDEDKLKLEKAIIQYYGKRDLTKQILKIQPIHYDENKIWWIWNKQKLKWEVSDDTAVLNFVSELSIANTIKTKEKMEILEALKQESRLQKPKPIKKTWIQFKDIIVDIETGEEFKVTPKYFVTNPIPWQLHSERFVDTPIMDKIFEEWVGKDYVKTLYEILAYCLLPDYPIHRLFCLIGGGLNGKGCFLRLLTKFVGEDNVTSTELDVLLSSRFEITRLHKKLVCMMGETNFNEMSQTSILKKLTGQDTIGFEYKNKNPFTDDNYAKILIATNNLPTTTDKTIGFYRRWYILDFPNQFSEKKDILSEIPEEEYEILGVKSLMILKDLLSNREFHKEGSIEDRMKRYEDHSDPLTKFLKEFTEEDPDGFIFKAGFQKKFNNWCSSNKFRNISDVTLGKIMKEKGIHFGLQQATWLTDGIQKRYYAWLGVKWKGEDMKTDWDD
ncbi:MAG: phage/plasmid primase, P4 family [Bacteroidales bacterium]|jgi:P4 family phage/plasmid primase-like protien